MTTPVRLLRCPICVNTFAWTDDNLYEYVNSRYTPLQIPSNTDPRRRADLLRDAYKQCPHSSQDNRPHFLPVAYGSYRDPLVIGLVGAPKSGKTHLLTAMIAEIGRGGLLGYGLTAGPVDASRHRGFLDAYVRPLIATGAALSGTKEGQSRDFADALLITSADGTWPVAFFDVAGDDLTAGRTARFLAGAGALIFVVDPDAVGGPAGSDGRAAASHLGDETFGAVLSRLRHADRRFLDIPAAIVVTKSDRLRFEPPVDRWMSLTGNARIDARVVTAESRAAYAFLYQRGALAWLQPFHDCLKCTLHFVSATGAEPHDGVYPRGVRPRRVLEPLIALLAMTGILTGPDSVEVGT